MSRRSDDQGNNKVSRLDGGWAAELQLKVQKYGLLDVEMISSL